MGKGNTTQQLTILTWNVGSVSRHLTSLLELLSERRPHLVCLQESQLTPSTRSAVAGDITSAGYSLFVGSDGLATLVRRDVNAAPIAPEPSDSAFRVQRIALQIGPHRALLRHRHADAKLPAARAELDACLLSDCSSKLVLDVGDFNELPAQSRFPGRVLCFPKSHTFRRSSVSAPISTIDGAVASPLFGPCVVDALPFSTATQHCPVMLQFSPMPNRRWKVTPGVPLGDWSTEQWDLFRNALSDDAGVDHAWELWRQYVGCGTSVFQAAPLNGAWSCGARGAELDKLFKIRRKQLYRGDHAAAAHTLDLISTIIDDGREGRLQSWRDAVRTRCGAARWVKAKMSQLSEAVSPTLATVTFCANDVANRLAPELAERWNTAWCRLSSSNSLDVSAAMESGFPHDVVQPSPPPCPAEPHDLSYFRSLPKVAPATPWTPEAVLEFMPSGAPGLDGHEASFISGLGLDSIKALCLLLNLADERKTPTAWCSARVTLIPKPGEAIERRPLTILGVTYRLWARRHAARLQKWLLQVRPRGLSGAVPGVSCADVLWEVQSRIHDSTSGRAPASFVLSMDLSKCFDMMLLSPLDDICKIIGFTHGNVAISIYQDLQRILFVDGCPSDVLLRGDSIRGVPQGCPISCCLCNLYALAWHHAVSAAVPSARLYTVLDDRLALCESWSDMAAAVAASVRLDKSFGPKLNFRKTKRGVAFDAALPAPRQAQRAELDAGLRPIDCVSTFKYLGVDIRLRPTSCVGPTSRTRARDLKNRCSIISALPRFQRSACTTDALQGLWAAGGTVLSKDHLRTSISHAFGALTGKTKAGRVARRSRAMSHLMYGPGLHHTCTPVVLMLAWVRQWVRCRLSGRLSACDWEHLWAHRARSPGGYFAQLRVVHDFLGISWNGPYQWTLSGHGFSHSFCLPTSLNSQDDRPLKLQCADKPIRSLLHEFRVFARCALCVYEAGRRPKHFGGLEVGMSEDREIRQASLAMRLVPGGPSLSTGGIWTAGYASAFTLQPECPRCGFSFECTYHRLWGCPRNAPFRALLDRAAPGNNFPQGLPSCLWRCGLVPSTFQSQWNLTPSVVRAIQRYLLDVNAYATACTNTDDLASVSLARATEKWDPSAIFRDSIPPLKKTKRYHSDFAYPARLIPSPKISLPHPLPADQWSGESIPVISVDGSAILNQQAGFGGCVACDLFPSTIDFCGPVTLSGDPLCLGAESLTNNTAELSAQLVAALWLSANFQLIGAPSSVILEYDSEYAASLAQGRARPRANISLVIALRSALRCLPCRLVFRKALSHSGLVLNEHADRLAAAGAAGHMSGGIQDLIMTFLDTNTPKY